MCEDWPCCGHEQGCCPDYDSSGKQLNMKCVCGATLPVNARYSICKSCMEEGNLEEDSDFYPDEEQDNEYYDKLLEDREPVEDQHLDGLGEN